MYQIRPIFKREFFGYFRSPVAFVFMVIFLFASFGFTFFIGGFYESNQASLDSFFTYLPWLFLILVPAVGMRLWSEEKRTGSIELLFTMPITTEDAVIGKFLAGWAFLLVNLALTFPLVITVNYLGSPDNGVIFSAYLGSALMAGAYLAISCLMSSLTKNQVIAFILGVITCFVMILISWGIFTDILAQYLPASLLDALGATGFMTHFRSIARGLIDSRDILYFLSVIAVALALNISVFRKRPTIFFSIVAIIALNIIASRFFVRMDVTQDRIYSLSEGTSKILDGLSNDVTVKFYFSRSSKELPPLIKTYATRVEEVLGEYKVQSHGRISLEVIDPKPDTDEEEWARRYGINGVRLPKGEEIFFGVVFLQGTREVPIPYLDPRKEEYLEYDLSDALLRVTKDKKPKIGIMSSLPLTGGNPLSPGDGGEPWAFVETLKQNYDVKEVAPEANDIPADLDLLILFHPKALKDESLYAIDQFVLSGKRLIVLVDPLSRSELATAAAKARMMGQMPNVSSSIPKLFKAWGIEYDETSTIGDLGRATRIFAEGAAINYPLFLSFRDDQIAKGNAITNELKFVMLAEPGEIAFKGMDGLTFEPFLTTSKDSGKVSSSLVSFMGPQDLSRELKVDGKERVLAGMIKGKFKTAFPEGRPEGVSEKSKGNTSPPQIKESQSENSILVFADTDFVHDSNAVEKIRFINQVFVKMRNDNLSFLLNGVDLLAGSNELISLRSKGRIARPFTRVQDLQVSAQKRWQEEERNLTKQLEDLQKNLSELQSKRTDGAKLQLSAEQQSEIQKFRDQEQQVRRKLREVRKGLREDIEQLGRRLIFMNMAILPLGISLLGIFVYMRRSSRSRKGALHE